MHLIITQSRLRAVPSASARGLRLGSRALPACRASKPRSSGSGNPADVSGSQRALRQTRRRDHRDEKPLSTGGDTGPPRGPPPPPRSTAEGAFSSGGDEPDGVISESKGLLKWKGWEDRVKADPQFAYKVLIEQDYPLRSIREQPVKQGSDSFAALPYGDPQNQCLGTKGKCADHKNGHFRDWRHVHWAKLTPQARLVFSTLALGSLVNLALMYLIAPTSL